MTASPQIDELVRKVPRGDSPQVARTVLYYDIRKDSVLDKPRPFTRRERFVAYEIQPEREADWEGPTCEVSDFRRGLEIRVATRFHLALRPGEEETLVRFLAGRAVESALTEAVTTHFTKLVQESKSKGSKPVEDFYSVRRELIRGLDAYLEEHAGLITQTDLRALGEADLDLLRLHTDPFFVRPKDSDHEYSVSLRAELGALPAKKGLTIAQADRADELKVRLKAEVQQYFHREVGLMELRSELNSSVREGLQDVLERSANAFGRKVDYLFLDANLPDQEPTVEIEETVESAIKGTPERIPVANTLRMTLTDAALWERHGSGTVDSWCREALADIIRDELFEIDYLTLLLKFEPKIQERVKRRVAEEAAKVGYAVQHHLVLPDVEPLRLQEGFSIPSPERLYSTQDTRHQVGLETVVSGRIADLEKIKPMLKPKADIQGQIRQEVENVIEQILHRATPERFYLEFKAGPDNIESVEQEIRREVAEKLKSRFGAEDLTILPKMVDTPLTERITQLTGKVWSFDLDFKPLQTESGVDTVRYHVIYQITGVAMGRWDKFLERKYESIEDEKTAIDQVLEGLLKQGLEALEPGKLDYSHPQDLGSVQRFASKCTGRIADVFGLELNLISMGRDRTDLEDVRVDSRRRKLVGAAEIDAAIGEKEAQALLAEHDALTARRLQLLESGVESEDPDLADVDQRLSDLKETATAGSSDDGRKLLEGSADKPAGSFADLDALLDPGGGLMPSRRELGAGDTNKEVDEDLDGE